MNDQRKVVYEQRKDIMRANDVSEQVVDMRHEVIDTLVSRCIPENAYAEQWEVATLHEESQRIFALDLPVAEWAKEEGIADEEIRNRITDAVDRKMAEKAANVGPEIMRMAEKSILLQILDQAWKDHLLQLDHLRQGIGLRAYGQRDPLNEYKREAFELFEGMLRELREQVTNFLCHVEIRVQGPDEGTQPRQSDPSRLREGHEDPAMAEMAMAGGDGETETRRIAGGGGQPKVARNAPCPCGSGKKYKHCHGRV
jgi:preprotein translocase subunit SecA